MASARSAESFRCLPLIPAGPLSVVTKPILTLSAARAGRASSSTAAAAARCFFIGFLRRVGEESTLFSRATPGALVAPAQSQAKKSRHRRLLRAQSRDILDKVFARVGGPGIEQRPVEIALDDRRMDI